MMKMKFRKNWSGLWKRTALWAFVVILATQAGAASASKVKLDVGLGNPVMLAGQRQKAYLRVSLTGFEMENERERTPANVAIVLDRSGSMSGEKLEKAKEAAIMAVDRLDERDIISIIVYESTVRVLLPATRASDKEMIRRKIRRIRVGGNTALFAGVSKGAFEIRKFVDPHRVNRLILLSDGLANVGPSSPGELGQLGSSLIQDGISVTTIGLGLGYNEDLMTRLAYKSDGNHYFAEDATELARIFDSELGDVLSVVAQEVITEIDCAPGVRPIRVIGRDAEIEGNKVRVTYNQLYSAHEKYIVIEVEVPAREEGSNLEIAKVSVRYDNMRTKQTDRLSASAGVSYSHSEQEVEEGEDAVVMESVVEQIATEKSEEAVQLRDEGRIEEAQQLLKQNAADLKESAKKYKSGRLDELRALNERDADAVVKEDWNRQRKGMREKQYESKSQSGSR